MAEQAQEKSNQPMSLEDRAPPMDAGEWERFKKRIRELRDYYEIFEKRLHDITPEEYWNEP